MKALAAAGHTAYASMCGIASRNADTARRCSEAAERDGVDLRVVELDVTSQESADAAVRTVLGETGQLDAVVQTRVTCMWGYTEAFTAEDVASLLDTNVVGVRRVNRAVLPHVRGRHQKTLL